MERIGEPDRSQFRKPKTAVFLQPLKHNARWTLSFFSPDRLPTLHLPFPSQPCGHKESSISVNRIKCSIDPASHSILQDTFSNGLNKAPKTPKPDHLGPIPPIFAKEVTSVKGSNDTGGGVIPIREPFGSYPGYPR